MSARPVRKERGCRSRRFQGAGDGDESEASDASSWAILIGASFNRRVASVTAVPPVNKVHPINVNRTIKRNRPSAALDSFGVASSGAAGSLSIWLTSTRRLLLERQMRISQKVSAKGMLVTNKFQRSRRRDHVHFSSSRRRNACRHSPSRRESVSRISPALWGPELCSAGTIELELTRPTVVRIRTTLYSNSRSRGGRVAGLSNMPVSSLTAIDPTLPGWTRRRNFFS
jgi:hypothetical protein